MREKKRIYVGSAKKTDFRGYTPVTTSITLRCKSCTREYSTVDAEIHNHVGFCQRKCKRRYFKSRDLKDRQKRQKEKKQEFSFYKTERWKELRFRTLRRYGFSCMACGRKPPSVILHVDHIKPRSKYPALEWDPDNLQVLCASCNQGKLHYFEDDLDAAKGNQ